MNATHDEQSEHPEPSSERSESADGADMAAPELTHNKADGLSPGEILREGRLAHGYSVGDLCAQTKLNRHIIEALEENDFEALSQPVFARGYYRSCAGALDLDVDRLMAAYNEWAGQPSAPRLDQSVASAGVIPQEATPGGHSRFRGAFLLLLLAAVVIAVIVYLFPSYSPSSKVGQAKDSDNQTISTIDGSDSMDGAGGDLPFSDEEGANPASDSPSSEDADTSPDMPAEKAGAGESTETASSSGNGNTETDGQDDHQDESESPDGAQVAEESGSERQSGGRNLTQAFGMASDEDADDESSQAEDEPEEAEEPAVPPNQLVLTFSKRSWVKITDANGDRLAQGIFESGDKKEFSGKPPYKVTLGYAPGVKASIGGQTVDVDAQSGGKSVAHLTIDAASSED